jgi:hypothetical protein
MDGTSCMSHCKTHVWTIISMIIDYDIFCKVFLTGINLQNVLCYLCNQSAGLVSDPITETLTVLASTPLSLVITEAGIAIFRDKPTMVYPYSSMNSEQLLYIKQIVDTLVQNSQVDNPKLKGHIQMGGGCIIALPSQTCHKDFILEKNDLLHAFIESVNKSNGYNNWTKKALCSIIMQRLACTTNLPKEMMHHAAVHSETLFATHA